MVAGNKTRFSMFEVVISLDNHIIEKKNIKDLRSLREHELLQLMESSNFVSQNKLEEIISKGEFSARGESINLSTFTSFSGQLEKDERNKPYWRIFVTSRITATPTVIKKYFLEKLFQDEKDSSLIKVSAIENEIEIKNKLNQKRWNISDGNSKWYPGRIRKAIVEFQDLLEDEEVVKWLKQGGFNLNNLKINPQ